MDKQPDILLINAGGTKKKVYQELSKDFSACEPPFWAALTAGFLRDKGFSVALLDANALNLNTDEAIKQVEKIKPVFSAVVVYSQQANTCTPIMSGVITFCRQLKRRLPEQKLIVTGWHPSALPEKTMEETGADYVAQGEGFYTLLGLLKGIPDDRIPGLWYRQNHAIRSPEIKATNVNMLSDELKSVAWDLIPFEKKSYRAFNWMCLQDLESRSHYASMFTSLGCPFRCTYCAIHATYGDRRVRYWTPKWVLDQIDILYSQYGVRNLNLIDELFIFNPQHYLPIAQGLIDGKYEMNICAFARVDVIHRIDIAELRLLKKAGFNWIKLGIESSNSTILKGISKNHYDKEMIRQAVEKIHRAGIDLCANFMFGLPGDSWETMQETLNFAMELNCAFPSFFCTMAPPGSDLYAHALKSGTPLPDAWSGYAQQGYEFLPLPTENLSAAQVLAFRDFAFDTYFTNPRYLQMIDDKFGKKARRHIERMTAIKLERKILGD